MALNLSPASELVEDHFLKGARDQHGDSLQCRRILSRTRASAFDHASAIVDSNTEEAWGETKMRPREWD